MSIIAQFVYFLTKKRATDVRYISPPRAEHWVTRSKTKKLVPEPQQPRASPPVKAAPKRKCKNGKRTSGAEWSKKTKKIAVLSHRCQRFSCLLLQKVMDMVELFETEHTLWTMCRDLIVKTSCNRVFVHEATWGNCLGRATEKTRKVSYTEIAADVRGVNAKGIFISGYYYESSVDNPNQTYTPMSFVVKLTTAKRLQNYNTLNVMFGEQTCEKIASIDASTG